MNRVLAMARKEVYHILRDRRSLGVAILMPLAMVLVFGFAIDMELKHLPVAFLDEDHSPASRKLILDMTSSGFIVDVARLNGRGEIEPGFRSSRFRAAVVIPRHFARRLHEDASSTVQILIDGADGTTAATVDNYLNSVLQRFNRALAGTSPGAAVGASVVPVDPRLRIDFNPELVSAYFVVPGLVAVILMMICALLTSIALAREKETGTLEQVLTTPVTPLQVIVGKLLPYVGLGAIDAALVLGVGRFVFGVPDGGLVVGAGRLQSRLHLDRALPRTPDLGSRRIAANRDDGRARRNLSSEPHPLGLHFRIAGHAAALASGGRAHSRHALHPHRARNSPEG